MLMKRKALAVLLTIIIALAIHTWFLLNQSKEQEPDNAGEDANGFNFPIGVNQTHDVKITEFK